MELHKMTTTQTNKPTTKSAKIRAYIAKHPTATVSVVAKSTGADVSLVYEIKKQLRKASSTGDTLPQVAQQTKVEVKAEEVSLIDTDSRYHQVVDLISTLNLNFNLGSAIAHLSLVGGECDADEKLEELKSAIWYLNKEIRAITK